MAKARDRETGPPTTLHDWPRGSSPINNNYSLNVLRAGLLPWCKETVNPYQLLQSPSATRKTVNIPTLESLNVNLNVVNLAPITKGLSQKKDASSVVNYYHERELKYVKDVSCVDHLSFVKYVTNDIPVASNLPVGARLQNFWKNSEDLGAGPKVVQILREGYTLPFQIRPNLTRPPTIISCYVNPTGTSTCWRPYINLWTKSQ